MKKNSAYITACMALAASTILAFWPVDPVRADDDRYEEASRSHEEVYKYRKSHKILPFEEILKLARPHMDGKIIETEFEYEDGVPAYEFKYIDPRGRVMEMYIDARNGKILKIEEDD